MIVPHSYYTHHEKVIHCVGDPERFKEVHNEGDPKNLDFLSFYGKSGKVVKVCGSQNRIKDILTLSEGLRLNFLGDVEDWKNGAISIPALDEYIRESKRSGCFRDRVFEVRNDPVENDVIWITRDESYELKSSDSSEPS